MNKSCLYFDKKYKCVFFIVHYKGLTLTSWHICTKLFMDSSDTDIRFSVVATRQQMATPC